jgi:Holliday junction resolvase RusA-like endonuclease
MSAIAFTILGEPASKANSRVLSVVGPKDNQRTILRKGNKALSYEKDALRQIPPKARVRLEGPVRVTLRIFYASQRPDLDESIVLDVLQDRFKGKGDARQMVQAGVYRNDRQVREKHVFHALDRANPRAEIVIEPLQAQQAELPQDMFAECDMPF